MRLTSSSNGTWPPLLIPTPVEDCCKGSDPFFSGRTLDDMLWTKSENGMAGEAAWLTTAALQGALASGWRPMVWRWLEVEEQSIHRNNVVRSCV